MCSLKIERLERQIISNDPSDKTKGPKQDSQSRLSSPMPEGGNLSLIQLSRYKIFIEL